jgi:transcriptional regulator with XRE-family HTH domain
MEIQLAGTLKSLRQKNNKTQDDLALFLGISSQAVSKWERSEGFPDITLLPRIAGYFHVSVDELLGVDEISRQNRIDEITSEYNRIRHHVPLDPDYRLDEGIELIRNALTELPGVFFFEQLLAADLSWKGKNSSDTAEKTKLFEEAITLCEDILTRSTEDRWRDCAKQILLVMYADLGMTEKALELAYQMPGPRCTCEYMLTYILKGEDLNYRRKLNAVLYYQIFRESILQLSEDLGDTADMIHGRELAAAGIGTKEYLAAIENVLQTK